ncbi:hypothetical protein MPNT_50084 [Candidatus Methylacidithermus pantelleriae]|uniref:Uncharacterized protein n=1 Tax=Candidatus Methylacidithermus pantelleriae TaxID=2744239 RepID=A0A8J2FX17_9BACT|nr:hypothetical protein MPNT_50084 [Candidatus Methylacidithermus pantelleriae]
MTLTSFVVGIRDAIAVARCCQGAQRRHGEAVGPAYPRAKQAALGWSAVLAAVLGQHGGNVSAEIVCPSLEGSSMLPVGKSHNAHGVDPRGC